MLKVLKAIFDLTFDNFWRESKAIFYLSQMWYVQLWLEQKVIKGFVKYR